MSYWEYVPAWACGLATLGAGEFLISRPQVLNSIENVVQYGPLHYGMGAVVLAIVAPPISAGFAAYAGARFGKKMRERIGQSSLEDALN